jgi:hypothetical protein
MGSRGKGEEDLSVPTGFYLGWDNDYDDKLGKETLSLSKHTPTRRKLKSLDKKSASGRK